jgi:hypothetical protein
MRLGARPIETRDGLNSGNGIKNPWQLASQEEQPDSHDAPPDSIDLRCRNDHREPSDGRVWRPNVVLKPKRRRADSGDTHRPEVQYQR